MTSPSPHAPALSFPNLARTELTIGQGRSLPRWEAASAIYHVALHLGDSVPTNQIALWQETRERVAAALARPPETLSATARAELLEERRLAYAEHIERYLSAGHGECWLRHPDVQQAFARTLEHENGSRYDLHLYTIMPNHVHVIVGGFRAQGELTTVVDQWKRISAHAINRIHGRTGDVWRRDAYTRIIRTREEYANQLTYVWNNPELAGLSSGFLRKRWG